VRVFSFFFITSHRFCLVFGDSRFSERGRSVGALFKGNFERSFFHQKGFSVRRERMRLRIGAGR